MKGTYSITTEEGKRPLHSELTQHLMDLEVGQSLDFSPGEGEDVAKCQSKLSGYATSASAKVQRRTGEYRRYTTTRVGNRVRVTRREDRKIKPRKS
jgi:hypothetical protein